MPRKPRIHVPEAFYHVTLRGNHRQDIFFTDADRLLLNALVAEVIERFGARVHAYCWMTNHVHLLMQVGTVPLWRLMLRIASRYARQVQRRFRTTGHLFECRYHAVLVDADEYLLTLIRYIHMNPVVAGMVPGVDDYPWSSHHDYLGTRTQAWVTTDFALAMLHRDRPVAVSLYRQLIGEWADRPAMGYAEELNANDARVLGDDTFLTTTLGMSWQPKSHQTVDRLIEDACERFAVTREQLFAAGRYRSAARVRAWIAHQATTHRIASLAHIAQMFKRDESTLRKTMLRHFGLQ